MKNMLTSKLKRAPVIAYVALALLSIVCTLSNTLSADGSSDERWLQVDIGIIGTASDEILQNALRSVKSDSYNGLLIVLDTPGGALEATRSMVKSMMAAEVPVIVWVGPSGAHAGSAGAFITIAAHLAAMAPGTNIGAATPVQATGNDINQKDLAKKVENDTTAFMESIASARNRNVEMAVSFVLAAASVTADEALENKLIDVVAASKTELFEKLAGRSVVLAGGREVMMPSGMPALDTYQPSLRERFLSILSNPNLFYLLFLAGMIGLGFELTHPGSLFPGVVGGICMILALMATATLPVNFGAMLLVLAGVAFLVAEMFLPSFGILGIGGLAAFAIGSALLVDPNNEQGLRISLWLILPGTAVVGGTTFLAGWLVLKAARERTYSGQEGLSGSTGTVVSPFQSGSGRVMVNGENWSAVLKSGTAAPEVGATIRVTATRGLALEIEPMSHPTHGVQI